MGFVYVQYVRKLGLVLLHFTAHSPVKFNISAVHKSLVISIKMEPL